MRDLEPELAWFTRVLDRRLRHYFPQNDKSEPAVDGDITTLAPPALDNATSPWAAFVRAAPLGFAERLAIVTALVPHLRPRLLDVFFTKNATFDRRFTEFGGVRSDDDFEPTGETLAFLLGEDSLYARATVT